MRLARKPPDTLPLVGNGLKFLQARWKLLGWFNSCQRHFGYETVALTVPTLPPGVLIHDPKNLEFVFKHEGLFTKGAFVRQRSWDLFGEMDPLTLARVHVCSSDQYTQAMAS
jgi:hypothetical protein